MGHIDESNIDHHRKDKVIGKWLVTKAAVLPKTAQSWTLRLQLHYRPYIPMVLNLGVE